MRTKRCRWILSVLALALLGGRGGEVCAFTTINWGTAAAAPVGRSEAQGIMVDGKLYVLGGFQSSPFGPTDSAYAYDTASNTWTTLATMPLRLTHTGVAAVGRQIFVAGGYFGSSSTNFGAQTFATKAVWRYDIDTNTWSSMPDLPQARGSGGLVARGRFLHFFGGADLSRNDKGEHWILNLDSGGWVAAAPMPNPRSHMGFAELAGKVYVVGGQHDVDAALVTQNSVHCFDPTTGVWSEVAPLPVARGHISTATFSMGGRILVLGGETSHGTSVSLVHAYDPLTNAWSTLTSLPANRYSGVAGSAGGLVYYATGSGTATTYKGAAVGFTGLPDIAVQPARVVVNDVQGGAPSAAQLIVVSNPGEGPLTVTGVSLGGAAAAVWQVTGNPTLPAIVPAGGMTTITVAFGPAAAGPQGAVLQIASDDPDEPLTSIPLRGLGTLGLGGSNEPSLQWILDTWQIPVVVGDPDPSTNSLPTSPLLGEEVSMQTWRKAGSGSVTLEPLGVFGPQSAAGIVTRVGWYQAGNAGSKQELFTVSNASYQTLVPTVTGALAFDPAASAFGMYSIWPFFSNREVFSEDALNTFSGAVPHHVRVYPLKDLAGALVPDAYVVATEEHISGFDYQDVVYVLRNVRPATDGCVVAADCPGTPPECSQKACNAGQCQVVPVAAGTPCTDDGSLCTVDQCNGNGSCGHGPGNAGAVCRPAAGECDVAESCTGTTAACPADGWVAAGTPCASDGNLCTTDVCNGAGSCGHPPNTAPCDDGNACTAGDVCAGGLCTSGTPFVCDDGDACTSDACLPSGGCSHTPLAGQACDTGAAGVCAAGTTACQGGTVTCAQNVAASPEVCDSGADEDCDGEVDETAGCAPCPLADTVRLDTQTRKTTVRLAVSPDRDAIKTKGSFELPAGSSFAPQSVPVTLRVGDAAGAFYVGTLPAGSFVAASSGRSFKFKDRFRPFEAAGLKTAKFSLARDGVTVKYAFTAQDLNLPAFLPGTGTATIQIGTACFVDGADACTASAASAKCQ